MAPKILLPDNPLSAMDIARELAPSGFDTVIARPGGSHTATLLAQFLETRSSAPATAQARTA